MADTDMANVWVGWIDGGAYSDKWTTVMGVYRSMEAGQRYGRSLVEREIARYKAQITDSLVVASGGKPYADREDWVRTPEADWRDIARRSVPSYQKDLATWEAILHKPWREETDDTEVPAQCIYIENAAQDWRFTLGLFAVQESVACEQPPSAPTP